MQEQAKHYPTQARIYRTTLLTQHFDARFVPKPGYRREMFVNFALRDYILCNNGLYNYGLCIPASIKHKKIQ